MQDKGAFFSPLCRPRCLAAAAPAGRAKLTHPGKAILAGEFMAICRAGGESGEYRRFYSLQKSYSRRKGEHSF